MPTCAGSTRRAPLRPSLPREAARRLLRPGTRAAHPRACAPPPLPWLREIAALRALLPHARAVRGLRAPLRARAGVLRRRHLHQLCGDGRGRGGHRAGARLDRRADAHPAARDRGGARRAGPARVLPPCAEPVARDELPGGDGRATARAGAPAGALNARAVRGEGECLAHACRHRSSHLAPATPESAAPNATGIACQVSKWTASSMGQAIRTAAAANSRAAAPAHTPTSGTSSGAPRRTATKSTVHGIAE